MKMREIYDPVYYPPVIQGFDDYRHHQQQQQYRRPPPQYQPPPPVAPKSSSGSSSSSSSVLGKFLKLGKSKSDVGGGGLFSSSSLLSPSAGSTSGTLAVSRGGGGSGRSESCELDDFRLSPSVISRGPVQKMVHNKANKRDVSRSHSWIYGSVKLASDLPFGYGDQFTTFQEGDAQMMGMEDHHSGGGGGGSQQSHYLHTHGLHAMQIPRCQLPEYSCTCDCGGRDGGGPADFGVGPGGSMRNGPTRRGNRPPCQGCAREMAMKYALPKGGRGGTTGGGNSAESFVSSVRKLTWKSLKQVVKKRPSLDTLKKMPPQQHPAIPPSEYLSAPIVPMPYLSPSAVAAASATQQHHHPPPMREVPQNMNPMANPQSHYGHGGVLVQSPPMSPTPQQQPPQPDYFFPEKKQFYASCNDIYDKGGVVKVGPSSPPNHVTASVRVRPKRTRQPWQFPSAAPPSEFGPVPNYEEDGGNGNPSGLYHSEWDLRNVMSYDMWMNATSNVKPRTGTVTAAVPLGPPSGSGGGNSTSSSKHSGRSHSADARHYHSSGNLHLPPPDYGVHLEPPTTFRPLKQQSSKTSPGKTITNGKGSVSSSKSLTSLHSPLPSSSSVISAASSSGPKGGSISSSHSSDTLKISTFANTPSNPNKSPKAGIIKRSSILAADVTAYQLLKQQTKKGSQSSSSSSVASSIQPPPAHPHSKGPISTPTSTPSIRQQSILKNKQMPSPALQPPPVELEDAFSESSDDLSDNAVNGPSSASDSSSMKSRNSSNGNTGAKLGVRIAGQGIRMSPNPKTTTTVINCTPPPQKSPSMSVVTNPNSNARAPTKRDSGVVVTRGLSPESDMWSDCHNELVAKQKSNSISATITPVTTSGSSSIKTTSVKVNGINGSGQTGAAGNGKRQTFVTFEKQPPPPPQLPPTTSTSNKQSSHHHEADMEFEEYEVDHHRRHNDKKLTHKSTSASLSAKSLSENKVSLNVTTASPSGTPPPKATYIKHNKSSSTSTATSSSASSPNTNTAPSTSAKFGALRRRKNRSVQGSGCTSPGKLLQETIYEEEDPEIDDDGEDYDDLNDSIPQRGQSPHHLNHPSSSKSSSERQKPPKHSVKIMVGAGAQTQSSSTTTVKPILKNHQRSAYETPVVTPSTVISNTKHGANHTSDSCTSSDISNYFNNNSNKFHPFPSESRNDEQIYFDSSVSTTSTKKKVQFDQSKVVVCGGSSASSSSAGSGGDEEEEEPYDYENDDSDQWSNKSSEEEEEREEKQQQQEVTVIPSPQSQQQPLPQLPKGVQGGIESATVDVNKTTAARARSLFEEEVARKAASMARSRQQKKEQEEANSQTTLLNNHVVNNTNKNGVEENVNNLSEQQRRHPQQSNGYSDAGGASSGFRTAATAGMVAVLKNTSPTTNGIAVNKNATNSQGSGVGRHSGTIIQPCQQNDNNRKDAGAAVVIVSTTKGGSTNKNKGSNNNANDINGRNNVSPKLSTFQQQQHNTKGKINTTKVSGGNTHVGSPATVIVNPNSLLFHDTTRIRLNQTRPALHDSTFKLPNGNGSASQPPPSPNGSTRSSRGITRLKQSNSFRSVSSVAFRPRDPPPPPPSFIVATSVKGSSLSSMPARLQKALSTSTLLSKSTEKLNLTSGSASVKNGGGSHYGLGGRLLPSKSQISLPVSVTTTSKTAGLLASSGGSSVSMETLHVTSSPSTVTASTKRRNGNKNCASLASRSKSLTDRCSALEKVLQEQKKAEEAEMRQSRQTTSQHLQLRPAPSLPCLSSALPKDDMDSKNIEIVTKENDVSEIRIYSASNVPSQNNSGGSLDDEHLPYQGIIYESTKTIITNDSPPTPVPTPVNIPPPVGSPPKSAVPPPRPSPPEMHYAATDLFPAQQQQQTHHVIASQKVATPKSSPSVPFSHPPLPPIPSSTGESEYECTGKSVVLFIENGGKKKPSETVIGDAGLPVTNYSQPIDTISRGVHRQHPQTPLPLIPAHASENIEEPLYDDVVNNSLPDPPPPVPKTFGAGSLGRKSLGGELRISPPHQLGELPPLPPPVPPHRTPLPITNIISTTTTSHHEVISSTLPCLACPPSLPPPNLPSKSLSEFHNRPLVIQENEEESILEEEVDNLYNDIGTPSNTLKSSTAATFANAMKEAFLGAIGGNKRNSGDFSDRRSIHSTGSVSSGSGGGASTTTKKLITSVVGGEHQPQLIYDDTLSISSSGTGSSSSASSCGLGGGSSRIISHQTRAPSIKKAVPQQMVPLPPTPAQQRISNKSLQKLEVQEEPEEEPLYDDVLNLSEQTEITANNNINNKKDVVPPTRKLINAGGDSSGASEYHSSNSSDSGTEDLPPPLPTQGPPPLPKELPLLTFPLMTPTQQPPPVIVQPVSTSISGNDIGSKEETMTSRTIAVTTTRSTRTLLTELNEKLSKLNVTSSSSVEETPGRKTTETSNMPCSSSSTSPGGSSVDASSGEFNSDSFHISKVVISPSSESSGVEEDYNSERNYSLSLGGSRSSSNGSGSCSGGSDNENGYGNNNHVNNENKMTSSSSVTRVGAANGNVQQNKSAQGMPSEAISMARGKFLENMKLSMLGGGSSSSTSIIDTSNSPTNTPSVSSTPRGLLMMGRLTTASKEGPTAEPVEVIDDPQEEPIYEEIGDNLQNSKNVSAEAAVLLMMTSIKAAKHRHQPSTDVADDDDEDDNRSASPVYADAFDAKSMFDGASRSEILSFLESIRDRLTGAESATSTSDSQSSSISRSSTTTGVTKGTVVEDISAVASVTGGDETTGRYVAKERKLSRGDGGDHGRIPEADEMEEIGLDEQNETTEMQLAGESTGSALPQTKEGGCHEVEEEIMLLEKEKLLCPDCNDDIEEGEEGEQNNNNQHKSHQFSHHQHPEDDPTVTTGLAHPGGHEVSSSSDLVVDCFKNKCCRSCNRKRNEKKEIIMEIYETELKYGRDLRIVSEEFYKPIQVAGLLAKEQLDQIFLNVDQLIQNNLELTGRLKTEIQRSQQRKLSLMSTTTTTTNDSNGNNGKKEDELSEVNVGKIFLELGETMMTAFENYCTRQASAGALLSQLEKEKELLRIFLRVSQMENTVLRRMNLPAFLMVPVQRVTRYPLLLSRLLKVTPVDHFSRDELQSAQEKIEQHLEHMNKTTREVASVKLWRRISIINGNSSNGPGGAHRRSNSDLDTSNIRIRKMALDVLDWTGFNDVTCVLDNQLGGVHFNGKLMRNIYGCLLVRGKDLDVLASKIQDQDPFFPPAAEDVVKDVKLVLVRVKNTRFCLLREPLCLSKCVVSQGENEFLEFIEINEITTKNTYFIQGLDKQGTASWLRFLQCYASCVGHWRRRRPALANIMMNGMIKHL